MAMVETLQGIRNTYDRGQFIIGAGPCSTESRERAQITNEQALKRGLSIVRVDLSKPRTSPFKNGVLAPDKVYEGAGEEGFPWLRETIQMGLIPATEVMLPNELERAMEAVHDLPDRKLVGWIGARNTNHKLAKELGALIKDEDWVELMVKCPWAPDGEAWKGMVGYAMVGGANPEQLSMCYSGTLTFDNGGQRRVAAYEWAKAQKLEVDGSYGQRVKIPMLYDPCHIGKKRADIFGFALAGIEHNFDGAWLEVDPYPDLYSKQGHTDDGLSWTQFDELQASFRNGRENIW